MSLVFDKVAIIGVGLLGGSVGLALKANGICGNVVGLGRSRASIEAAFEKGAIDEAVDDLSEAASGADLVVVCTPAGSVAGIIAELENVLEEDCIITDVGSTKQAIVDAVEQLPRVGPRFVGSHPLAGSEKKGVQHASANLFDGATVFLTSASLTDPAVAEVVGEMWESFGGRVVELGARVHDRVMAQTSHLPHIVAALLVAGLRTLSEEHGALVGKGFLDTTRIASSDPEIWADICITNPVEIREALVMLRNDLETFEMYLTEGEYERILDFLRSTKSVRDALNQKE
jgi:prephenate dehydrogenase